MEFKINESFHFDTKNEIIDDYAEECLADIEAARDTVMGLRGRLDEQNNKYAYETDDILEALDNARAKLYSLIEDITPEDLDEDTVKVKDHKWTNKGKDGTHGYFKTKKEADQ